MVRTLRSSSRRVAATLAAAGLLTSLAAVPHAAADKLKDEQERVEKDIGKTLKDLDHSSAALAEATAALEAAEGRLAAAEAHLAKTRGELAAAVVLDRQMQARLDAAIERLERAQRELEEGQAKLAGQEEVLGQIAVRNYQSGDPQLLALTMVLQSQDPVQLTNQLNSVQSVLDKETVTLDRLEASRVLLTVKEQEVEAAKEEVEVQRKAAAENLERKKALEAEAESAKAVVAELVTAREVAQAKAVEQREADLEVLRSLQKEQERIAEMLRKRAAEARRRARAAAAAAAAKEREAEQVQGGGAGSGKGDGFLLTPVEGYVTSEYGMRFHPVYHEWSLHDGIDYGAACGTPIRAAAPGRVIAVYFNEGYGNRVIIDNGYARGVGLGTAYNHLSSFSTYVGQKVERGEVIGYVGNTGFSTGCHLHFMVFENGATVNPRGWL